MSYKCETYQDVIEAIGFGNFFNVVNGCWYGRIDIDTETKEIILYYFQTDFSFVKKQYIKNVSNQCELIIDSLDEKHYLSVLRSFNQGWIPTDSGIFPKENEDVLVTTKNGEIKIMTFSWYAYSFKEYYGQFVRDCNTISCWTSTDGETICQNQRNDEKEILAWQSLPEPYLL